ncbi:MAG: MerR family DNA-binding protein [Phycisphaeraceae bacterium]
MNGLRTGELATQAHVHVETLRFYERRGLLPEPPRRGSYRAYPPEAVERVRFIKRAQELGFTLSEIKQLLELGTDEQTTCADVKQRAQAKIADVREKRRDLQRMEQALVKLAAACPGKGSVDDCPILGLIEFEKANNGAF